MKKKVKREVRLLRKTSNNDLLEGLDNILTDYLTNKTVGDICRVHENTQNTRVGTVCHMILLAITEGDINLINSLIKRVDGGIPKAEERDKYANILGNALEIALAAPKDEKTRVCFDTDTGIIALAKAILTCATMECGKNQSLRKDRLTAVDMLLSRTGGTKTEPVKEITGKVYVDPSGALEE